MNISRLIPCGLSDEQASIVMSDICRGINYQSRTGNDTATLMPYGLKSLPWEGLPGYVESAELHKLDMGIKLVLNTTVDVTKAHLEPVADVIESDLSKLFNYKTQVYKTKVFCIGWPKTGTSSLTEALRILGLFSWHFSPWIIGSMSFDSDVLDISARRLG